jgi:hypothetical protein
MVRVGNNTSSTVILNTGAPQECSSPSCTPCCLTLQVTSQSLTFSWSHVTVSYLISKQMTADCLFTDWLLLCLCPSVLWCLSCL